MNEIQSTPDQTIETAEAMEVAGEIGQLSYRQLIWRRFRKNRMGIIAGAILIVFYILAIGADFFAPYHYSEINMRLRHVPPQRLHFSLEDGFYVHGLKSVRNPESLELEFTKDLSQRHPAKFFFRDAEGRRHLFSSAGPMFLLGTDRMGRDLLSRIMYGARVSMTLGLVGVFLSIVLGSILGTISGYYGGWIDNLIQRIIEILSAFPDIPLWMALGAALPPGWSSIQIYFGITVILSIIRWGGLARQVRGKVLAYRESDFVMAARAAGAGQWHIITKHLLTRMLQPYHCYRHACYPRDDFGGNRAQLLGFGHPSADDELGCFVGGSTACDRSAPLPVAYFPSGASPCCCDCL